MMAAPPGRKAGGESSRAAGRARAKAAAFRRVAISSTRRAALVVEVQQHRTHDRNSLPARHVAPPTQFAQQQCLGLAQRGAVVIVERPQQRRSQRVGKSLGCANVHPAFGAGDRQFFSHRRILPDTVVTKRFLSKKTCHCRAREALERFSRALICRLSKQTALNGTVRVYYTYYTFTPFFL